MDNDRVQQYQEKHLRIEALDAKKPCNDDVSRVSVHGDTSPYCVTFSEPLDPDNPKNWSLVRKSAVTSALSATGFNRIVCLTGPSLYSGEPSVLITLSLTCHYLQLVSTIMAPAIGAIAAELHMNKVESVMGLSSYLLATAFGPLFIAPLSEVYGRQPVLHTTNVWFLLWNLVCGFAHTKSLLLAARFLAGLGASAVYVLAGGVLGDVWRPEQRGRSLGLYNLFPLLAASVGPIIGGVITQVTTWRWIFWSTSIVQAILLVFCLFVFKETYAPVILQQQARHLRKTTRDKRYHTANEALSDGHTALWNVCRSLSRPMRLLASHPIVQLQAAVSGFNYGITYLVISIYSDLWKTRYHQSTAISGLHYLAMCAGEIGGALSAGILMDVTYRRLKAKAGGNGTSEFHLPVSIPTSLLIVAGFLMFGWAAEAHVFWLVVDIGSAILSFGLTTLGQVMLAYVIDAYAEHTSSAQAGAQSVGSLTAFGFPLFAPRMYEALGYGGGNTLLAGLAVMICVPAPVVLWRYGAQLREKAKDSF